MADDWMDEMTNGTQTAFVNDEEADDPSNPFAELERYFAKPRVSRERCPDVIRFWGVRLLVIFYLIVPNCFMHSATRSTAINTLSFG